MNAIEMPCASFCGASKRKTMPGVSTWPPPIPSSPLRKPATKPSRPSPAVVIGLWVNMSTAWLLLAEPPGMSSRTATNSRKMPNIRRRLRTETRAVARAPSMAPTTAVAEKRATSTTSICPLRAYGTALTNAVGMMTKSEVPVARCWLMPSTSTMPGTRIAAPPIPSKPLSRPVRTPMIAIARQWARTSTSPATALAASAILERRQPLAQRPVHQPPRPAAAQHAHDLVERLLLEDVEPGAGQPPGAERLDQRRLVDDGTPAGVDQVGGRFHQRQLRPGDHVARLRVQQDVERDVVALAQQLLDRHELGAVLCRDLGLHEWVGGEHPPAEAARSFGHELADVAKADDAERRLRQPLDRPDRRHHPASVAPPVAGAHDAVHEEEAAGAREDQRHRVRRHFFDAVVEEVGDRQSALGRRVHVDRVVADRALDEHLRPGHRVDHAPGETTARVDYRVGVADGRDQVVLAAVRVHHQLGADLAQLAPLRIGKLIGKRHADPHDLVRHPTGTPKLVSWSSTIRASSASVSGATSEAAMFHSSCCRLAEPAMTVDTPSCWRIHASDACASDRSGRTRKPRARAFWTFATCRSRGQTERWSSGRNVVLSSNAPVKYPFASGSRTTTPTLRRFASGSTSFAISGRRMESGIWSTSSAPVSSSSSVCSVS